MAGLILLAVISSRLQTGSLAAEARVPHLQSNNNLSNFGRVLQTGTYTSHICNALFQKRFELFSPQNLSALRLDIDGVRLFLSPLDSQALRENWVAPGVLPFAYSEADPIYLKPGANTSNAVFITYHDGSSTEELAPTIEAFAAALHVAT